jgi:hypothetical protein
MESKRHDAQRHRMHSSRKKGRYQQTMTIMGSAGSGVRGIYVIRRFYPSYVPLPIIHHTRATPHVCSLLCQEPPEDYGGNKRGSFPFFWVLTGSAKKYDMGRPADRRGGGYLNLDCLFLCLLRNTKHRGHDIT